RSATKIAKPTYLNIIRAFQAITEQAQSGEQVYIHYSGHGGQVKTAFPELKGMGQNDEALVPMDLGYDGRYLRDVEITTLLKRLTDKGCIVTVIFDSCHSGGATRGDGAIRGSRNGMPDSTPGRSKDSAVTDNRQELLDNWQAVTQNTKDSWLASDRRDYVFLGACRPNELANESAFEGKDRNGALTHWMFETLRTTPSALTYQALYDRLKGKIISQFANQVPMLSGEANRLIFGSATKAGQYLLAVIKAGSTSVTLDGGKAQGIRRGTRFALYPAGQDQDRQKCLGVVEVRELQATSCTAKILDQEESGIVVDKEKIASGLVAVMESAPVNLKHRVSFYQKQVGNAENELPQAVADQQTAALEKVRQAIKDNGWLIEAQSDEEGHFQVAIARQGDYEIAKNTPIDNLIPALGINDADAPNEVVKRLVHLAKYQTAQALDNPVSELTNAVEFELVDAEKQPFADPNNISLVSGDRLYVRLKNVSSQPLNAAILDFEATWEISSIPIEGNYSAFYSLQPGQETMTPLRFAVPEGEFYQESVETLKLFITRGNANANFQWLILPPLDPQQLEEEDKQEYRSLRGSLKTATRSAGHNNALSNLLATIGADPDNPPEKTRASYDPDPNAEWLTKSISLTIADNKNLF
ncbi:MAG: caspase family protein, partial [Cyanobacteria bacterium J06631_2]